jgi:hypothetical protein
LFDLIHSVDSLRLLREIDRCAQQRDLGVDAMLEVNVSGEERKYGLSRQDVPEVLEQARDMRRVRLVGFMTMAPLVEDPERSRPVFRGLRELRDMYAKPEDDRMPLTELSMRMTQDYEVAIEEGATMVRVGSALFR